MNGGHKNKLEKVEGLLVLSLSTQVTLKYRILFEKDDR